MDSIKTQTKELKLPGTRVALNAQSSEIAFEQIQLLSHHYGTNSIDIAIAQLERFLKLAVKYEPCTNPQCCTGRELAHTGCGSYGGAHQVR